MKLLITDIVTSEQIQMMRECYISMIKIVVDIRRGILAGGGEMHSDCEQMLLENASEQNDLWGANWYPDDQRLEYEALINIRPTHGNRSISIQSQEIREAVKKVTLRLLGDMR